MMHAIVLTEGLLNFSKDKYLMLLSRVTINVNNFPLYNASTQDHTPGEFILCELNARKI